MSSSTTRAVAERRIRELQEGLTKVNRLLRAKSAEVHAPIQFVIDVVYNNGIRPVWNGIAGVFGLGKLDEVRLAGGGVLPGYAPGVDSVPAMLSPGEAVLTPEATRFLGPANILGELSGWPRAPSRVAGAGPPRAGHGRSRSRSTRGLTSPNSPSPPRSAARWP
ncbi:hypothetical protein [Saccharopolyspora sp. ASAGF58]|uniref:hypothetical protein n=1 Tax=Saccharopolyspora sp. ASAGF58 TaxID=2719023 RepID=UPI00143FBD09|nr:hypothetical protein [Saccharopolyspora sp. ASAGF58]QIZ35823.1 hypothetical protein FDZ84_15375 [Saccharopolyspora sp. ASAGF58]